MTLQGTRQEGDKLLLQRAVKALKTAGGGKYKGVSWNRRGGTKRYYISKRVGFTVFVACAGCPFEKCDFKAHPQSLTIGQFLRGFEVKR